MRRLSLICALVLGLMPSAGRAQSLTYDGRDAQGLHCAAMLLVVTAVLEQVGELTRNEKTASIQAGAMILAQLPGTPAQKDRAVRQRSAKIMATRTPEELAREFVRTSDWCVRTFFR